MGVTRRIEYEGWLLSPTDIIRNPGHTRFKGIDYPVLTVDNGIQLICDKDLDDDLVYKLAKAAIESIGCMVKIYAPAKALTPAWMASELANPFHPGAIKYFKEKGL